jgi:hypothetical protein
MSGLILIAEHRSALETGEILREYPLATLSILEATARALRLGVSLSISGETSLGMQTNCVCWQPRRRRASKVVRVATSSRAS